jgi:hypothetical protein
MAHRDLISEFGIGSADGSKERRKAENSKPDGKTFCSWRLGVEMG